MQEQGTLVPGGLNLTELVDLLPCAAMVERGGTIVARNEAACELLGETPRTAQGGAAQNPLSEQQVFLGAYPFSRVGAEAPETAKFDCAVLRLDGSLLPVRGALRRVEAGPEGARLITLMQLGPGENGVAGQGTLVGALLDAAPEAVALTAGGRVLYVNREFERLFGFQSRDVLGHDLDDLLTPEDERARSAALYREIAERGKVRAEAVRLTRAGERLDVSVLVGPVAISDGEPGVLHTFRDIREQKRAEAELEFRALHDPLTGLANRGLLQDRLQHGLKRLKREPERSFGVLFLDLDGFKAVNDALGHEAGDEVLRRVASCLQDCVRPQDTVARVGGDEFALLLEDSCDVARARLVADRLLRAIAGTSVSESLPVSASIGVVLVNEPNGTADRVLRQADIAMYHAKAAGKARSMVFEPGMSMSRRGLGPPMRR